MVPVIRSLSGPQLQLGDSTMLTRPCPVCRATARRFLPDSSGAGLLRYFRCDQCGCRFVSAFATAACATLVEIADDRLRLVTDAAVVEASADVDAAGVAGARALHDGDLAALDDALLREAGAATRLLWMLSERWCATMPWLPRSRPN